MNVSLKQLRVFLSVAQFRSFSKAGDAIGLTQPAVSRAIRELENALGAKLLDRTTRDVELTVIGQRLSNQLDRVLNELEGVLEEARKEGELAHGTVHIGSVPTLSASIMPTILSCCVSSFPHIRLQVHDQVQRLNIESVRAGEIDFAIVVDPGVCDDLLCLPLLTDDFWLVCRQDHPLAQRPIIEWGDLSGEALVLLDGSSGSRFWIDKILRQKNIECDVVQEMGHPVSVFQMVQAGIGVSIAPGLSMPLPEGSSLVVRPVHPAENRTIMLIRRKNRSLYPVAEKVWQLIVDLKPRLQSFTRLNGI